MRFDPQSMWALLLLLAVPVVAWRLTRNRTRSAIVFSSTQLAATLPRTWKQRLWFIVPLLQALGLLLLIVALARPQEGRRETLVDTEGIAIEMLVDRSGSMRAMDFDLDGQPVDRLRAIKDVASRFIVGDDDLEGRPSDLVGLIAFAGYADSITPLTLDHGYAVSALKETQIVSQQSEDGTAIGDAVGLAVEKLRSLNESRQEKDQLESRVIILLTDGENNAGTLDPQQAAELAKAFDVRIYTIGVGSQGRAPVPVADPFTRRQTIQWVDVSIDEKTLQEIAKVTGGKYYRATNTESLARIYEDIDQLEKSQLEERSFVEYRELAIEPFYVAGLQVPPLLMIAFGLVIASIFLEQTLWRSLT